MFTESVVQMEIPEYPKCCPVLGTYCERYAYQCDSNGDVAICYCNHSDNHNDYEGSCTDTLCPIK